MKRHTQVRILSGLAAILLVTAGVWAFAADVPAQDDRLAVVWTSGDPHVAERVCFMYTHAAKRNGWFDEVRLVIWGPSQKLFSEDEALQAKVKAMQDDGIIVEACVACAKTYDLVETIRAMDIPVKPMGEPLTGFLKQGYKVLTF